jgi:gas vesicle protein
MSFNQDRRDNGHDRAFLAGLVAGTVVGAGLGLLLAPKTGAEMRSQLGTSAEKFQRNAVDSYHRASARVIDLVQRSRGAIQKGREAFDQARDVAVHASERFPSALDQSSR